MELPVHVTTLPVFLIALIVDFPDVRGVGSNCSVGWFGPKCTYLCHCVGGKCDTTGECTDGAKCVPDWFGPACQYVDATVSSNAPRWLRDHNKDTCSSNGNKKSFSTHSVFSWARMDVHGYNDTLDVIDVEFENHKTCDNMFKVQVEQGVLEFYCPIRMEITQLSLSGSGVSKLCSLYLSGGRNVALKQSVRQSTTLVSNLKLHVSLGAEAAVDGKAGHSLSNSLPCSYTEYKDPSPTWTLTFRTYSYLVDRTVLFASSRFLGRMHKYKLEMFNAAGIRVVNYQDKSPSPQKEYAVIFAETTPIKRISIYSGETDEHPYLQICEFRVWGEAVCEKGEWGLDCSKSCKFCKDEDCTANSGLCLRGCVPGKFGLYCQKDCPAGRYGMKCNEICSPNCATATCNGSTGECLDGCKTGHTAPHCKEACAAGKYGPNCTTNCPINCGKGICEQSTGDCIGGCNFAFRGDKCNKDNTAHRVGAALLITFALMLLLLACALLLRKKDKKPRQMCNTQEK